MGQNIGQLTLKFGLNLRDDAYKPCWVYAAYHVSCIVGGNIKVTQLWNTGGE